MRIPMILGMHLHLWLGIILLILILFQIIIAKKVLNIPFAWHRINGYLILAVAVMHGIIGSGLYFGLFQY